MGILYRAILLLNTDGGYMLERPLLHEGALSCNHNH